MLTPSQREAFCSDWVVAEGRVSHAGLRRPGGGFLGQCSWPGEDPTLELFGWQEGAAVLKNWDFSSRQYSGMHFSGSQHSYLNENLAKHLTQKGFRGCYEEKHHAEVSTFSYDSLVRDRFSVDFLLKQLPWVAVCTKFGLTRAVGRGLWCEHLKKCFLGNSWLKSSWGGESCRGQGALVRKGSYWWKEIVPVESLQVGFCSQCGCNYVSSLIPFL